MKRVFRAILLGLGVLLIVLAVGGLLLATRLDQVVREAIEVRLSYMFMADVAIEDVNVSLFRGLLEVRGLTVSNPPTFKKGPAMAFEQIRVLFDLRSLLTRAPRIERIAVTGGDIHLRYELGDGSNLGVLARNVSELESGESESRKAAERDAWHLDQEPMGLRRPLVIGEFVCEGATGHLSTNVVPLTSASLDIAPFTLHELTEGQPVSVPRMVAVFVRSIMVETVTFKGLLAPVVSKVREEIDALF
ncbi:MAG TPA: hypothetical protein PLO37_20015 [Candidatus Hydrogenedentes bacterium]|nr:hypothetical protein [Candidatus Hydrogenedentota bacterium]HPG69142.1 hypothetical protein [Candidatus Hydrogenedentota bacterium]